MPDWESRLARLTTLLDSRLQGGAQYRFIHALLHAYRCSNGLPISEPPFQDVDGTFHKVLNPDLYTEDGGVLKGRLQEVLGLASSVASRLVDTLLGFGGHEAPIISEGVSSSVQAGKYRVSYHLTHDGYALVCQAMRNLFYWVLVERTDPEVDG